MGRRSRISFPIGPGWLAILAVATGYGSAAWSDTVGRHLAVNLAGDYAGVLDTGFDLADVGSVAKLNALPDGMKGVLWLGNGYNSTCEWRLSDAEVTDAVKSARVHPKFSGIYYISDEPHPAICPDAPARIAERSKLIRALDPRAQTFIVVQNGSSAPEEFALLAGSADLIGVDPYPCNLRNAESGCDLGQLRERVAAAFKAGIPPARIVPVFQVFGQSCPEVAQPWYRLPEEAELEAMLDLWDELVPPGERALDMSYSWASQKGTACPTLSQADGTEWPDLKRIMKDYFLRNPAFGIAENDHD